MRFLVFGFLSVPAQRPRWRPGRTALRGTGLRGDICAQTRRVTRCYCSGRREFVLSRSSHVQFSRSEEACSTSAALHLQDAGAFSVRVDANLYGREGLETWTVGMTSSSTTAPSRIDNNAALASLELAWNHRALCCQCWTSSTIARRKIARAAD
eukprot:1589558-Rhodomonas_salina.1